MIARTAERARDAGAALRAAVSGARVELADRGTLDESTWNVLDLLTDQLLDRLDEHERAERLAGIR